ncbi:SDR family oxidoreductase [Streptomyces stramineus]
MTTRTALLAGATGLVGGHLLTRLLADPRYTRVTVLVRGPCPSPTPDSPSVWWTSPS